MVRRMRLLLVGEAATFIIASLVHFGYFVNGYEHTGARIPEAIIAAILLAAFLISVVHPGLTLLAAIWSQGAALLGTFIGVFTIIIGVGPRTVPDIIYHILIIIVLAWGLRVAWQAYSDDRRTP